MYHYSNASFVYNIEFILISIIYCLYRSKGDPMEILIYKVSNKSMASKLETFLIRTLKKSNFFLTNTNDANHQHFGED